MSAVTFVSYKDDPKAFCSFLLTAENSNLPSVLEFELESRYRAAEIGDEYVDLSFFILGSDGPLGLVLAHKIGDFIGFNGSGIEVHSLCDLGKKHLSRSLDYCIEQARLSGAACVKIDDLKSFDTLSILGQEIYNKQGMPTTKLRALQDLEQSEAELHKKLRQSYKSLVNQGKKEIEFKYLTEENSDLDDFCSFKDFHKKISGRQTRPSESWDVQFDMIKAGSAELILGYIDGHGLVSSALFTDYGQTTSYAVAVYDRDLFDKPLAHASVYEGMLRAKSRGKKIFNLGVIPHYDTQHEKEYNIGKFKKGFCRKLYSFIEWQIDVQ